MQIPDLTNKNKKSSKVDFIYKKKLPLCHILQHFYTCGPAIVLHFGNRTVINLGNRPAVLYLPIPADQN